MNGHHANVQLSGTLSAQVYQIECGPRGSEVWKSMNGTLVHLELENHYSGEDNIVNLEVKVFPRATHILKERLVSVSGDYEASVSGHIRVAGEQGFNLVAIATVVIPERTQYVTYFQVQEDAVFDAPFPYDNPMQSSVLKFFRYRTKVCKRQNNFADSSRSRDSFRRISNL